MSVVSVAKDTEVEVMTGKTIIQFWICQPVDQFRQGQHVYEISGKKYVVIAYCSEKRIAFGMCSQDRIVAKMEVHDYHEADRLAHKKNWTFSAWILPYKSKRLR